MTDNIIQQMRRKPSLLHACTHSQRQLLMRIQQLENARESAVITVKIRGGRLLGWSEHDAADVEIREQAT